MTSAGILPVFIDKDLNIKILLGKEYNGWSGFSGNSEHNESALQTAIREFNEETSHIFKDHIDEAFLQNNTLNVCSSKTPTMKIFTLYIVNFSKISNDVLQKCALNFQNSRNICIHKCEKEKTEIKWFDINDVKNLHLRYSFHKDFKKIYKAINNFLKLK